MSPQTNPSISTDCVIFGFDGKSLKVLLVKRDVSCCHENDQPCEMKLPGSLIFEDEDIDTSSYRILEEMTGLKNVFLKQFYVFSDPKRIDEKEYSWLRNTYGVEVGRIVTVAYYSLVKLDSKLMSHTKNKGCVWMDVNSIKRLAMDHKSILVMALNVLTNQFINEPIAFELLPKKFTVRQLQNLYEAILGVEIDNRNFRKKILNSPYILSTGEKEISVAHKPAQYYVFNKAQYEREFKHKVKLNFINWHG